MNAAFEQAHVIIPAMSGLIFMATGLLMYKFPPKKINHLYAYRTKNSMKDQAHWDFAQKYSAVEMMKLGGLLALIGLLAIFIPLPNQFGMAIGLGLMILMVIVLFIRVEQALKRTF